MKNYCQHTPLANRNGTSVTRLWDISKMLLITIIPSVLQSNYLLAGEKIPGSQNSMSNIIFETDFRNDTGYFATQYKFANSDNVPTGWDAVKVSRNSSFEVINNPEIADKPVLKIKWDPKLTQPTVRLYKHLTGDINKGYSNLYIRYQVRLPPNFKAGNGKKLGHWKWGRLWQNTAPENPGPGKPGAWTENREDSYYVVWNFGGSPPYTDINTVWGANTGTDLASGSSGGERYNIDYFVSGMPPESGPGYFEQIGNGAWDFYSTNENAHEAGFLKSKEQTWHTIEYHFQLASSPTANDGVQEVWFDGVLQSANFPNEPGWTRIKAKGGATSVQGIPTSKHGSGFNMFVFFDNLTRWNKDWGNPNVDGFIYVSDVVVSTNRIGHDYRIETRDADSVD